MARRLVELASMMARAMKSNAMQIKPRERLIVALDVSSVEAAQALVARLGDAVSFYKIGYQLAFAGGLALCALADRRRQAGLRRSEAARHRQYGGARREKRGAARRDVSHRARLSADHAGGGASARREFAHSCRHRAHLVRRRRPQSGRLCRDRGRARRPARRASARHRRRWRWSARPKRRRSSAPSSATGFVW